MALQVGILALLFYGDRVRQARYAVFAGLGGFSLGLVHSYDVITIAAIWLTYLAVRSLRAFKSHDAEIAPSDVPGMWQRGLLAGAITSPAVLYVFLQLKTETVFRARANVPTLSQPLICVLL